MQSNFKTGHRPIFNFDMQSDFFADNLSHATSLAITDDSSDAETIAATDDLHENDVAERL